MYKFSVRAEKLDDCECRNAKKREPSDLYAGIYNRDGYGVASIDRLGRRVGGEVPYHHPQIEDNDEPDLHATTDAEWHSIMSCISAAPAMLAVLRSILADLDCGEGLSVAEADFMRQRILAVLAKAEPPSKVKHTVWVTVAVDVETNPGEASKPDNVCMAAIEAVRDGEGEIVRDEIIETN